MLFPQVFKPTALTCIHISEWNEYVYIDTHIYIHVSEGRLQRNTKSPPLPDLTEAQLPLTSAGAVPLQCVFMTGVVIPFAACKFA